MVCIGHCGGLGLEELKCGDSFFRIEGFRWSGLFLLCDFLSVGLHWGVILTEQCAVGGRLWKVRYQIGMDVMAGDFVFSYEPEVMIGDY